MPEVLIRKGNETALVPFTEVAEYERDGWSLSSWPPPVDSDFLFNHDDTPRWQRWAYIALGGVAVAGWAVGIGVLVMLVGALAR